ARRLRTVATSTGASAETSRARANTTLRKPVAGSRSAAIARPIRSPCTSAVGTVSVTRTAGRGFVGQEGNASLNSYASGVITAAGAPTSKGNAPTTIGTPPHANSARASPTSGKAARTPWATSVPPGPLNTNDGV